MRILHKNNQMCITNIKINTKVRTYLQSLWNQRRKLHYLQLAIRKVICRKNIYIKNLSISFCLISLLVQADLMLTGRLFQKNVFNLVKLNSFVCICIIFKYIFIPLRNELCKLETVASTSKRCFAKQMCR